MQGFKLGCNYWDSANGTDMWRKFDANVIREDMECLKKYDVHYLRVFPNWRDFQPVHQIYSWRGNFREYVFGDDEIPLKPSESGIDPKQIENFHTFARIAEENGISLIVSLLTGWMSGRLFVPPILEGKNIISDPEVLMWTQKYLHALVDAIKDCPNIIQWDLGNECNCLGTAATRAEAYHWTSTVRDSILSADKSRPISSGMHSLESDTEGGIWLLQDQGELTDEIDTHPYPSPTVGADIEPYNHLRATLVPTGQSLYYSGISGRPACIQESGTFSQACGNRNMSADWVRVNVLSGLANGMKGFLWWCAFEQTHLKNAPYRHIIMERELGMVFNDKTPKPVGLEIQKMSKWLDSLPFDAMPPRALDAVCVVTKDGNEQQTAISSVILGKQAGIEMEIRHCNYDLPKAPLYIFATVTGWQVTYRETWDCLMERVQNDGATLLVTFNGGHFIHFSETFGIESDGFQRMTHPHTAKFDFGELSYMADKEMLVHSIGAEVLASNEEGNPVFIRKQVGKGTVYFLGFPLEWMVWNQINTYADPAKPYYKIYETVAKDILAKKRILSDNPMVGVTEHPLDEHNAYAMVINYSDTVQPTLLKLQNGWKIDRVISGSVDEIPHCNGSLLHITNL